LPSVWRTSISAIFFAAVAAEHGVDTTAVSAIRRSTEDDCLNEKEKEKAANIAEQERQAAAEKERQRVEAEQKRLEQERAQQAFDALPEAEKAAIRSAEKAKRDHDQAVNLLSNGYAFFAHIQWCHDVREGYLSQYINDAELERAQTAIKAIVDKAKGMDATINTDDVWQLGLDRARPFMKMRDDGNGFSETCHWSLSQLFQLSPALVYSIQKPY
jgi:hypothetical protein